MSHDLRRDLHDLSQSERPFLDDLPIALLQKRAHRSRVRRAATYSAVGAGAAAAVVFGGIAGAAALRDRDARPEPPVGPQPTPTETSPSGPTAMPTLTPTPSATPGEAAWQPGWEACGETITGDSFDVVDDDGTTWYVSTESYPITAEVGEAFTTELLLQADNTQDATVDARVVDVTAASFNETTYAFEVVGIAAQSVSSTTQGLVPSKGGDDPWLPLEPFDVRITSCEASPLAGGDGRLDIPLPDGRYALMVTVEVTKADGEVVMVVYPAGDIGELPEWQEPVAEPDTELMDGPTNLTVGTPTRLAWEMTKNNRSQSSTEQAAWCGADAVASGVGTGFTIPDTPVAFAGTAFIDNGELILQASLTNIGATETYAGLRMPAFTVVRDGRVIAEARSSRDYTIDEWPTGATVQLEMSTGPFTCTFMLGEDWPAGTYELYYSSTMYLIANPPADLSAPIYFNSSGPWTFTIE